MICGIDEVGRGPLVGPVTAAAVVLPPDFPVEVLRDSKRLGERRRDELSLLIRDRAVAWAIGWASHREIDAINILRASHLAMRRAVAALTIEPLTAIVDGSIAPELGIPASALVKADATVPEVMAASIIAKVARDGWMRSWSRFEPCYEFERHKGYPTPRHLELIARYGSSLIRRRSFRVSGDETYVARASISPANRETGRPRRTPS